MARLMSFGEYRCKPISEVPLHYLRWCYDTFKHGKRRTLIQVEIERRERVAEYQHIGSEPDSEAECEPAMMMNRPPSKPETVSTLLARAEVLARQAGDDELASKILNLRLFGDGDANADIPAAEPADDVPPFDPPYSIYDDEPGYRIPSGKYRGCLMRDLTTQQLQRVWSGFNGVQQYDVADLLKAELRARLVVNR